MDQAFDYTQHTEDIAWIMVSNFDEFRLYNWQKGKYISFKIEELLDKRMYAYFMTSFSLKAYIKEKYQACLMEKTLVVERELEKRDFLPGTINTIMTGRLYAALQMVDPETIDVTEWLE
jgi:hypothetical protein